MGTRGLMGFVVDGKDFLTYNHSDSYPSGLGCDVLKAIKKAMEKHGYFTVKKTILGLIMIEDSESRPSDENVNRYIEHANPSVGAEGMDNKEVHTWYQLLRKAQGEIYPYLAGEINHMIVGNDFIKDSLFCEHAYIVNLDSRKLECYDGFQKAPDETNRYGHDCDDGYYPCKIIHEFDLNNLPSEKEFLEALCPEEEEE